MTVCESNWLDQNLADISRVRQAKLEGFRAPRGVKGLGDVIKQLTVVLEALHRKGGTISNDLELRNKGLGERVIPKQDEERDKREFPFHGLGGFERNDIIKKRLCQILLTFPYFKARIATHFKEEFRIDQKQDQQPNKKS